jgi:hypothetical protein
MAPCGSRRSPPRGSACSAEHERDEVVRRADPRGVGVRGVARALITDRAMIGSRTGRGE